MKKTILYSLLAISLFTVNDLNANWKERTENWDKSVDEKRNLAERNRYNVNDELNNVTIGSNAQSTVSNAQSTVAQIDDAAQALGLGGLGGLTGSANSVLSLISDETLSKLIAQTGLELLEGSDSSLLHMCYEKTGNFQGANKPEIMFDPCTKINYGFDGIDTCAALPELPNYKKKSIVLLSVEADSLALFCDEKSGTDVKETTIEEKILDYDTSKSILQNEKINGNSNVTDKVKRSDVAEVNTISEYVHHVEKVDSDGNPILDANGAKQFEKIQPLKGLGNLDTVEKEQAYRFIKKTIERKAAEGGSFEDVNNTRKIAIASSEHINVAFTNEHQYIEARKDAIKKVWYMEKEVFDTSDKLKLFKTRCNTLYGEKDNNAATTAIKSEIDSFMMQYKKSVDEWLRVKENYYFDYEKKGIHSPTQKTIEAMTKYAKGSDKNIKKASLAFRVEKEMNMDAHAISEIRREGVARVNELERKLNIIMIAERKFDTQAAIDSVGLED